MTLVPELEKLARSIHGEPRVVLKRLLLLVCEQLGMDTAMVSVTQDAAGMTASLAVNADGTEVPHIAGRTQPDLATWCSEVLDAGMLLVDDVRAMPSLAALPAGAGPDLASFAGVVLSADDGSKVRLCAFGHEVHDGLNRRDGETLRGLGAVIITHLQALSTPAIATQKVSNLTGRTAAPALDEAAQLEGLSRPLLDALQALTGLGSSYLTVIHEDAGTQEVRYAVNNRAGFAVPEGIHVPWADTLCKRAMDEGRPCTTNVPEVWGDSQAAAALGIEVYASVPVALSDGRVWGTLCAADSVPANDMEQHIPTMRMFSGLIATAVEHDALVVRERARADAARSDADTDPLTGCSSRRVVEPWLTFKLGDLRDDQTMLVLYADVNEFKFINDHFGHAAGDAVLAEVGHRLLSQARPTDLVARLGGDEFLMAACLHAKDTETLVARVRQAMTFATMWQGHAIEVSLAVGVAQFEGHTAQELVAAADLDMYAVKSQRANFRTDSARTGT